MASAASLPIAFDRLFKEGFVLVDDPGDAGTIYVQNKGFAICEIVTLGAESRILPDAGLMGVGATLFAIGQTLAGAATITGADASVVLTTAGDAAMFVVSLSGSTKVWRIAYQTKINSASDDSLIAGLRTDVDQGIRQRTVSTAADTATLTAAQLLTGVLDGTPTAGANYTLPTAALMVAAVPNASVGDSFDFIIQNKSAGANTITVLAGGSTLSGTATIAQNAVRQFAVMLTNVTPSSEAYRVLSV